MQAQCQPYVAPDVDYRLRLQLSLMCERTLRREPLPTCQAERISAPGPATSSMDAKHILVYPDMAEVFDERDAVAVRNRATQALRAFAQAWWEFRDEVGTTLCSLDEADAEGWYNEELAYAETFAMELDRHYDGNINVDRTTLARRISADDPSLAMPDIDIYITASVGAARLINVLAWCLAHAGGVWHVKTKAAVRIQRWWLALKTLYSPKDLVDSTEGEHWLSQQPSGCQDTWERWLRAKFIEANPGCDDTANDNYNECIDNGLMAVHHFIETLRPWQYTYFLLRSGFTRTYPNAWVPRMRPTMAELREFMRSALA